MKTAAMRLCVFLALVSSLGGAPVKEKPALLIIPAIISAHDLSAQVAFRWDEDTPVVVSTWSIRGELRIYGVLTVFDESGKEVPAIVPVSLPLAPTGEKKVTRDEILKLPLYTMGTVVFRRPGRYYAIAEFSSAFVGDTKVRFVTKKCWFTVSDEKPPKKA